MDQGRKNSFFVFYTPVARGPEKETRNAKPQVYKKQRMDFFFPGPFKSWIFSSPFFQIKTAKIFPAASAAELFW